MCYGFHLGLSTHMSRAMSAQERPPTPFSWGLGKRGQCGGTLVYLRIVLSAPRVYRAFEIFIVDFNWKFWVRFFKYISYPVELRAFPLHSGTEESSLCSLKVVVGSPSLSALDSQFLSSWEYFLQWCGLVLGNVRGSLVVFWTLPFPLSCLSTLKIFWMRPSCHCKGLGQRGDLMWDNPHVTSSHNPFLIIFLF